MPNTLTEADKNRAIAKALLGKIGLLFTPTGKTLYVVSVEKYENAIQTARKEAIADGRKQALNILKFLMGNYFLQWLLAEIEKEDTKKKLSELQGVDNIKRNEQNDR